MKGRARRNGGEDRAYLFPGQGVQSVGMGLHLYETAPAARKVFEAVNGALGRSLTDVVFGGPDDELRKTINAQPAVMAVSLACTRAFQEAAGSDRLPGVKFLAGHSVGEYTALAVAGVLDVGETAVLVQERARLMQEACERFPGAMAAVMGLDELTMEQISRETGISVSNVNTSEQIVVSGERLSVAWALDLAQARGARRTVMLPVGGAFHSKLMEPAREGLLKVVEHMEFRDPQIPIVANYTAEPLTTAEAVRQELIDQLCGCVQWKRTIDFMIGSGVKQFVELGPGSVLTGLVKRIDRDASASAVSDMESIAGLVNGAGATA